MDARNLDFFSIWVHKNSVAETTAPGEQTFFLDKQF